MNPEVMMLSSSYGTVTSLAFFCALFSTEPVAAQTRDPGELVAAYVREYQPQQARSPAFRELVHVLTSSDYPPASLEKLQNGLEQVALSSEPQRLRAQAALALAIPGKRRTAHPTGTFSRLERIYGRSADPLVRSAIVRAMSELAETREPVLFLERIAKQESADFPDSQQRALTSLLKLDEEGRAVLKRLHATNAVRNPKAKQALVYLAKQGYRSQ